MPDTETGRNRREAQGGGGGVLGGVWWGRGGIVFISPKSKVLNMCICR